MAIPLSVWAAPPAKTPAARTAIPAAATTLRTFSSQYYIIKTDLEAGLAQDLARRMDVMYGEYWKRLGSFAGGGEPQPSVVYLFARRQDYLRLVGPGFASTGGAFMPGRNVLAAFLETQGRDAMRRTLQHEALHQFVSMTLGDNLPIWLNEGMAQYFEEGLWADDKFLLGQVPPRRLRQLLADIKAHRLIPFDQFVALTPEQWAATLSSRGQTRGVTQYNQAWAMVYFLVSAADASGQPLYRQRLNNLLALSKKGVEGRKAYEQAFGANYDGFERFFVAFAQQLQPTPEAAYMERQDILGDMLLAAADHGWPADSIAALRDTVARRRLHIDYSRGQIHWSTDADTSVYFKDLGGTLFDPDCLYFAARRAAPLPDIVCRYSPALQLRTRFYREGGQTQHDTVMEAAPVAPPLLASPRK